MPLFLVYYLTGGGPICDVVEAESKDQAIAKLDGREPVAKIVEVKNGRRYID